MLRQTRSAAQYLRDALDHFGTEIGALAARSGHPLEAVRLPLGRRQGPPGRAGGGPGGHLPAGLELRPRGADQPPDPAARPQRQRQVDAGGLPAAGARALLHPRSRARCTSFNWIFPSQRIAKGGIGFAGGSPAATEAGALESYAYLEDDLIEAKIVDELRDHPILLLPRDKRRALIEERLAAQMHSGFRPAHQVLRAICPTATGRSSRRCCPRTTATSPRCCATSRSSASSSRGATGRRWPRSSRRWRWTPARGS